MEYVCGVCGYVYSETPDGVKWADLPPEWKCPLCGAPKSAFAPKNQEGGKTGGTEPPPKAVSGEDLAGYGVISANCSNLARACEKQYLNEESAIFTELAEYYRKKTPSPAGASFAEIEKTAVSDLESLLPKARKAAEADKDRGALRIVVWCEKATTMFKSFLGRFREEGTAFVESTNVYVCDICGFIHVGETPPDICPVCKVPAFKILKIGGRK